MKINLFSVFLQLQFSNSLNLMKDVVVANPAPVHDEGLILLELFGFLYWIFVTYCNLKKVQLEGRLLDILYTSWYGRSNRSDEKTRRV